MPRRSLFCCHQDTTLRDYAQGAYRMRGLAKGQTVHCLIIPTVLKLIRAAASKTPVLGVCLGHQALAAAFGGTLRRVDPPVHGKLSRVKRTYANAVKSDLFADCPTDFPVTRYHSLVVEEDSLPDELTVTARTEAGAIMGLSHRDHELHGVQFHPESIASVAGYRILANFLRVCGMTVPPGEDMAALESQVLRLDERFPGQMHP